MSKAYSVMAGRDFCEILKRLGFNEPCYDYWIEGGSVYSSGFGEAFCSVDGKHIIPFSYESMSPEQQEQYTLRPMISDVIDWLLSKYGILAIPKLIDDKFQPWHRGNFEAGVKELRKADAFDNVSDAVNYGILSACNQLLEEKRLQEVIANPSILDGRFFNANDMIQWAKWIADSEKHGHAKQLYEAIIRHRANSPEALLWVWMKETGMI